ncbi:MAG: GntR family transcriptional regulator [Bacteroidota bacterium]
MTRNGLQIRRDLPTPLVRQVRDGLRQRIQEGVWQTGQRIPSERELAESLGISRLTVRLAINDLVAEGLLHRQQGKGTFVAWRRIEQTLGRFYSFTEEMARRGMRPSSVVLSFTTGMRAPPGLDGTTHCLVRLRLADGEPVMLETTYISANLCPGLTRESLETAPLYELLRQRYGIRFGQARETFEPVIVPAPVARDLGVEPGSATLMLERTILDEQGRWLEFTQSFVRGDRCRYVMEWTPQGE